MPIDLAALVAPSTTTLLLTDVQRGVVGDLANNSPLARAAQDSGCTRSIARLVSGARAAHVQIIHCTAAFRPDGVGSMGNAPLLHIALKTREQFLVGSERSQPVLEVGPEPEDVVSERLHGVGGFIGTDLDPLLRSIGTKTVVIAGNSLNVAVIAILTQAIDLGYRVAVPRDAVVGVPVEYGELMLEHSVALLAKVTTVDELIAAWQADRGTA
jgi:nicotinamidase-related amidase